MREAQREFSCQRVHSELARALPSAADNARSEYFSTRSHEALQKARSLERSVDAYIKRGDDYLKKQNQEPTLFDNED